jgi:hypothetical protein
MNLGHVALPLCCDQEGGCICHLTHMYLATAELLDNPGILLHTVQTPSSLGHASWRPLPNGNSCVHSALNNLIEGGDVFAPELGILGRQVCGVN